jgi:hypothetical protein
MPVSPFSRYLLKWDLKCIIQARIKKYRKLIVSLLKTNNEKTNVEGVSVEIK